MLIFFLLVGGLLFAFGALLTMMSIVPTSMDASWDELKSAFRIMLGKPQFRVGVCCTVIGFLMLLVLFWMIL